MDFQTGLSLLVIVFLTGCGIWLSSARRPEWRRWSRVSAWVVGLSFLGIAGLFVTVFVSAWNGGIGD
jgi:hypothetical protein